MRAPLLFSQPLTHRSLVGVLTLARQCSSSLGCVVAGGGRLKRFMRRLYNWIGVMKARKVSMKVFVKGRSRQSVR